MNERFYTEDEVLQLLNASESTLKNWIKLKLLKPVGENFPIDEVEFLKDEIDSGNLKKFQARANKTFSVLQFIPSEYISGRKNYNRFMRVLHTMDKYHLNINESLLICALKIAETEGLTNTHSLFSLLGFEEEYYSHPILREELKSWALQENIDPENIKNGYKELYELDMPEQEDVLGALYQAVLKEGRKSIKGAYYTPPALVTQIAKELVDKPQMNYIDPCCGTGQYLLQIAREMRKHDKGKFRFTQVHGWDKDAIAVKIARFNFIIAFKTIRTQRPAIEQKNALLDKITDCYDIVATNPPWGARLTKGDLKRLQKKYPEIKSRDSYSYFLLRGLELVKPNGKISYLLPESILYTDIHKDVREDILKRVTIDKIEYHKRIFKRVFTPVLRIDFINNQNILNTPVNIKINDKEFQKIPQRVFLDNDSFRWDIFNTKEDRKILYKIHERPHVTLANQARWALGIVTGNNKRHLLSTNEPGSEPIITGRDILPCRAEPSQFINWEPGKYQQVADESYYRAPEKLVYRFVSNQLVVAYDNKKTLTLNSANILIPHVPDYPMTAIAAIFNSTLYQFFYQKNFHSIKVLRGQLEEMPLPILEKNSLGKLSEIALKLHEESNSTQRNKLLDELNRMVYNIYSINKEEQSYIEQQVKKSLIR